MRPPTPGEITAFLFVAMLLVTLIALLPACNDPACTEAHTRHSVAARSAEIEHRHRTFHGPSAPDPFCVLCQARRRDDN